ncbi:MAG: hypothetical protein ACM3S2_13770 [Ignavibacteriales bacterium]
MHTVIVMLFLQVTLSSCTFAFKGQPDMVLAGSIPGSQCPAGEDFNCGDTLSQSMNNMLIEVNVPDARTVETELGYVQDGGVLFTKKNEVTVLGTVKTSCRIASVRINGKKARFMATGDRYSFERRIILEDEVNAVTVSVTDANNATKHVTFTINRKNK